MTRQNPYTQRQIERAIRASLKAGLTVMGVRADGTVLTETPDKWAGAEPRPLTGQPKPRDAREKLLNH